MVYKKTSWQLVLLAVATAATAYTVAPWVRAKSEWSDNANIAMVEPATPKKDGMSLRFDSRFKSHEIVDSHDETLAPPARSRVVPETTGEAFAILSWLPPPPPAVIVRPPKPPPPTAPPLPFTFVGLMEKGTARPQAFLTKGDALLVVAAGDTIDNNTYRIESLNAQKIVLTYLPMNTQQTLNIWGVKQ